MGSHKPSQYTDTSCPINTTTRDWINSRLCFFISSIAITSFFTDSSFCWFSSILVWNFFCLAAWPEIINLYYHKMAKGRRLFLINVHLTANRYRQRFSHVRTILLLFKGLYPPPQLIVLLPLYSTSLLRVTARLILLQQLTREKGLVVTLHNFPPPTIPLSSSQLFITLLSNAHSPP